MAYEGLGANMIFAKSFYITIATFMTRIFFTLSLLFIIATASAQDAKQYYDKALELAQQGKAQEAISFFDKSIELKSDEYVAWYNRGITKMMINLYEDALPDFDKTLLLSPGYKKAYLNRGTVKKHLTDYDGAMEDYNLALKVDSSYGEAYYNRGLLNNLLGKRIPACLDFERALKLGYKNAQSKMESCARRPTADSSIHSIMYLTKTSTDEKYATTPEHPVRVGFGPEGGPSNSRSYLELLRDANGKPVKYERKGSCCPYESSHALIGTKALLDIYEITYTTADGSVKTSKIYVTFYDYEEPLIPLGLKTIAQK